MNYFENIDIDDPSYLLDRRWALNHFFPLAEYIAVEFNCDAFKSRSLEQLASMLVEE